MKKVLFLIHDLGRGGAEKILVNLANHLDRSLFEVHVMVLFGGGINEQFLKPDIHFHKVYKKNIPANSKWMKMFAPRQLHRMYIKEHFDVEVAYLEGPCARIISGCEDKKTKLVSWIHTRYLSNEHIYNSFRSKEEATMVFSKFNCFAFVSKDVKNAFCGFTRINKPCTVLYNTVESDKIKAKSKEPVDLSSDSVIRIIAVGRLQTVKRYDRLLHIAKKLTNMGYRFRVFIMGDGPLREDFLKYIRYNALEDVVTLLGYDINPYKYMAACDIFVCSSQTEGFSTSTTEALIVGTPVCTTDVSGMKELLGENNEYGIVTGNSEEELCSGIKSLLDDPNLLTYYKKQAEIRGNYFNTDKTVKAVEDMLELL